MTKAILLTCFLLCYCVCFSQDTTITDKEKATLDSMLNNDAFLKLMKETAKTTSYFQLALAGGNSFFSEKNKQLNATQLNNKFVLTPFVTYYHKSGLALGLSANMTSINGQSDFFQYMLNPSYTYMDSKVISAAVSYTRIFRRSGYENYSSPVENDLYATFYLKKPWIQPGISIGYANGKYTDYNKYDTLIAGTRRRFTDTAKTSVSDFSLNVFIQHDFEFYGIFTKKDGASITPQFMLNAGSEKFAITHKNPFITRLANRPGGRFKNAGHMNSNMSFGLQSVACNLDINYLLGKFAIEPQLYLDYYIPETTDKRFTAIYSVMVSYTF